MSIEEDQIKKAMAIKSDYEQLFKGVLGENITQDLCKRFHVYTTIVTTDKIDAHELAYAEGQRSVVLWLLKMISAEEKPQEGIMESQLYTDPT